MSWTENELSTNNNYFADFNQNDVVSVVPGIIKCDAARTVANANEAQHILWAGMAEWVVNFGFFLQLFQSMEVNRIRIGKIDIAVDWLLLDLDIVLSRYVNHNPIQTNNESNRIDQHVLAAAIRSMAKFNV